MNKLLRNHNWDGRVERRKLPRLATPYKLSSDWRTNTMRMFLIPAMLPIHSPVLLTLLLVSFGALIVISWPPRPVRTTVIPNDCDDPNLPWWRWVAQGCWMLAKRVMG
jgi:hypothetical protein